MNVAWHVTDVTSLPLNRAELAAVEERARAEGYQHVWLDCVATDTRLVRWYQREGYYPAHVVAAIRPRVMRLQKDLAAARALGKMFEDWQPELTGTLLFVIDADQVLLIDKKTGHGAGKINAPGGKLENGETPVACAVRETLEEVGIVVADPQLMARLKFADTLASQWYGFVFVAHAYTGTAIETAEADPRWYALDDIPYDSMWQDDRIWLPLVLSSQQVEGEFLFDDGTLRAHRIV
ncbi:MAG: 8-oxo-dGTP diphosphatase [Gammaproteobacteria bacterium]|nr:8-oxo-dGTP diphosphatase [Gammaproteobacteria bacterium]